LTLLAWGVQLLLNVGWSAAFFGRRSPAAGLFVIILLWTAIAITVALAAQVSRLAGLLLLPYLAWTGLATALNVKVWQLNSSARG
jgi:tryptophan-rich sensory protein